MEEQKEILARELALLVEELRGKYEELNLKASGQWGETLKAQTAQEIAFLKGRITGKNYTYYMQHGRASGAMPPIKAIEQWITNKGIPVENIKISSLAFLIARKIAKEGTRRYQNNGTPPFIDAVITPERIQQIIDKVGASLAYQIKSHILLELNQIHQNTG